MPTSALIQLIYVSASTNWPTPEDLSRLLAQARARNLRQSITGMLIYSNATYMQALEGSQADVHDIFDAICVDPRNSGVMKLQECGIGERAFGNWSMGFKHLDQTPMEDVPGFVEVFRGKLDTVRALQNKSAAIGVLLDFARRES